jgi:hypothetical protein
MSRYGEVRAYLGAEERTFRLGLGQIRAIQERCDAGLPEIAARLAPVIRLRQATMAAKAERAAAMVGAIADGAVGTGRVDDYREVIFQGLVGAGEGGTMAGVIVRAEVDDHAPLEMCLLALEIIMAVLLGPEDEPAPGETTGAKASPPSRARRSAGPASTRPAR